MRRFRTSRTKPAVPRGGTRDQYQYHHQPLCKRGGGTGGSGGPRGSCSKTEWPRLVSRGRPLPWWWPRGPRRKAKPQPAPPEPWPPPELAFSIERAAADEAAALAAPGEALAAQSIEGSAPKVTMGPVGNGSGGTDTEVGLGPEARGDGGDQGVSPEITGPAHVGTPRESAGKAVDKAGGPDDTYPRWPNLTAATRAENPYQGSAMSQSGRKPWYPSAHPSDDPGSRGARLRGVLVRFSAGATACGLSWERFP
jgi:hypothetical protein